MSDDHSAKRDDERRNANQRHRRNDVHIEERERHANSKRIDARRDGEEQQFANRQARYIFILESAILVECIPEHLAADKCEQRKRNPVGNCCYVMGELLAERPTDHGHERLESSEEQRNHKGLTHIELAHPKTFAD